MKKLSTLKTLLVGLCAMVATSAWAGESILFSQNYELATNASSWVTQSLAPTLVTGDGTYGNYIKLDVGNNNSRSTYTVWGNTFYGDYTTYTLEFDASFTVTTTNTRNQSSSFAIMADGYVLPTANSGYNSTFLFKLSNTANTTTFMINDVEGATFEMPVNVWCHYTIEVDASAKTAKYTIKNKTTNDEVATGTYSIPETTSFKAVGMYYLCGRYGSVGQFDNIKIYTEATGDIANPAAVALKGINGKERTYIITFTEGETLHYILPGESEATVSTGSSATVSTSTSGVLKVWTTNGSATSAIIEETVDASEITLSKPWVYISNMEESGSAYNAVIDGGCDQSQVLLAPTATLTATFTPVGGTAQNVTLPYTVTSKGILTLIASADGYSSSNTSIHVEAEYAQTWQSFDFSSLVGLDAVQEALGTDWVLLDDHGRWASWNRDKDGSYNFYQQESENVKDITINNNIFMRNVVLLAEGIGLGRNMTNGKSEPISIKNTVAGDIVKFEIYNGYGNDINKGTNTYFSYAISDGVNMPSINSTNGALLVQATLYCPPTTTATIGDNGYATFASPYNVKLPSGVTAYTAKVSGERVNFTKVENGEIPANTGVLLEGTAGEITLDVVATATALGANDFKVNTSGATFAAAENTTYFAMVKDSDPLKFGTVNPSSVAIPANKAYLAVVGNSEARLTVTFDGETTAIKSIENAEAASNAIYNLNGQRVEKAQKGLYIVNGKKTIVK